MTEEAAVKAKPRQLLSHILSLENLDDRERLCNVFAFIKTCTQLQVAFAWTTLPTAFDFNLAVSTRNLFVFWVSKFGVSE